MILVMGLSGNYHTYSIFLCVLYVYGTMIDRGRWILAAQNGNQAIFFSFCSLGHLIVLFEYDLLSFVRMRYFCFVSVFYVLEYGQRCPVGSERLLHGVQLPCTGQTNANTGWYAGLGPCHYDGVSAVANLLIRLEAFVLRIG